MTTRPHIVDGEFQSDKYPECPRGKVPLSVNDPTAQDLLWQYAQRRRAVDAEFADDLEFALGYAGYERAGEAADFESCVFLVVEEEPHHRCSIHGVFATLELAKSASIDVFDKWDGLPDAFTPEWITATAPHQGWIFEASVRQNSETKLVIYAEPVIGDPADQCGLSKDQLEAATGIFNRMNTGEVATSDVFVMFGILLGAAKSSTSTGRLQPLLEAVCTHVQGLPTDERGKALLIADAFLAGASGMPESKVFDAHAAHLMMCRTVVAQAAEIKRLATLALTPDAVLADGRDGTNR